MGTRSGLVGPSITGESVTPNRALLTDAFPSPLRAQYGAAKHER